jgi:hypothetical protein
MAGGAPAIRMAGKMPAFPEVWCYMTEGFYSNGLPHPSAGLRLRFAGELLLLGLLTGLFLGLAPESWLAFL